jgi:hypothetical protein
VPSVTIAYVGGIWGTFQPEAKRPLPPVVACHADGRRLYLACFTVRTDDPVLVSGCTLAVSDEVRWWTTKGWIESVLHCEDRDGGRRT